MANKQFDGTTAELFPFWHLPEAFSDDISISSDAINNICNLIQTNIVLPFPKALHVVHINAEDLLCHFGDVHELFFNSGIHIILISESWLKPFHPNSIVDIAGYNLLRHDRIGKGGGGVCAFVRDDLKYRIITTSNLDILRPEFLFFDLRINNFNILIGVIYKAPQLGYLSDIEDALFDILPNYDRVLIAGDFNVNLLDNSRRSSNLINMFNALALDILPLSATYQHSLLHNPSWLDLLITNNKNKIINYGQISDHGISKHHLIFMSLDMHVPKHIHKFITCRNFKGIKVNDLVSDAADLPWSDVDLFDNVDSKVDYINSLCNSLLDKHAPLRRFRVTHAPAPWLDDNIKHLMKCRDAAARVLRKNRTQVNLDKYKALRNKVKQTIRNSKLKFSYQVLNPKLPSNVLWKNIHKFGISDINNHKTNNNFQLEELNTFFATLPYNIDFFSKLHTICDIESKRKVFDYPRFKLTAVTLSSVRKAFYRIKSTALGLDGFSIIFLRPILKFILPALTHIFNYCINNSVFPSIWKRALVCPIPKNKNPCELSDWRPICILPVFSKALEYIIFDQLDFYVETHNLYYVFQSGFRKCHSTATALVNISDKIREAKDKHKVSFLILLDFSKAFNCINYDILYSKLLNYFNFSQNSADFFLNFLQGRSQRTKWDGVLSCSVEVPGGVPQGTVGGPKLFNLYINDLADIIQGGLVNKYADDVQLLFSCLVSEIDQCIKLINENLDRIFQWGRSNGIMLNISKTQVLLLGQPNDLRLIDKGALPPIKLHDTILDYAPSVKNLGVHFDSLLSWDIHIRFISKTIMSKLYVLNRHRNFIPRELKPKLVQSLLFPHFYYCDVVYLDASKLLLSKLNKLQNACVRYACNLRKYDHVSPFYNLLKWQRLDILRDLHTVCLVFKSIHCPAFPQYMKNLFISLSESHGRSTRSKDTLILKIPSFKLNAFKFSFTCTAIRLWNSLHLSIRSATSLDQFKVRFRARYFK